MSAHGGKRTDTGQLAQKIDRTFGGGKRKVQTTFQSLFIESKREPERSTAKVGLEGRERSNDPSKILERSFVDDIQVIGDAR